MAKLNDIKHIQHFIWDFDGTLFDTYPIMIKNLQDALAEYDYDCDTIETMGLMLVNTPTAVKHYAQKYGLDFQELNAVFKRHYLESSLKMEAGPMADVEQVLEKICKSGRFNYIFTHRSQSITLEYLTKYGLEGYFREIIGPESSCFASKPAPDAILYLMEKYKMYPSDVVMIGDRDCDLCSGRNAGIRSIHFRCALVPEELSCDWCVDSFLQLSALLGE